MNKISRATPISLITNQNCCHYNHFLRFTSLQTVMYLCLSLTSLLAGLHSTDSGINRTSLIIFWYGTTGQSSYFMSLSALGHPFAVIIAGILYYSI